MSPKKDVGSPLSGETAVGPGFRYRDDPYDTRDSTESTRLLGAGAHDDQNGTPKDAWAGVADFEGLPWWKRPSIWWLLGPFVLFTLAFGGSIVPKLNLIIDLVCTQYFSDRQSTDPTFTFLPVVFGEDNPQCLIPAVQKNVAEFTLIISIVTGILSALTAPRLGSLSDRYGRKRLMAICSAGGIVSEVVIILAAKYPDYIHYNWLILGAVFDGLAGSFTAGSALSHSYTSDCTPPSRRGVAYGYMHACLFFGLAFGPLLAAFLVEQFGSLLSIFYITLGCHVFFILFVIFILPESLSKKRQMMAREKHEIEQVQHQHPLPPYLARIVSFLPFEAGVSKLYKANPFAPLKILWPKGPANAKLRRNLITLSLIDMGILGAAMSSGTVTILYIQYMFNWRTAESSKYLSLMSLIRVFMLMAILPLINYFFRIRPNKRKSSLTGMPLVERNNGADKLDIWILRVALVSDIIGVTGYVFVRTPGWFIVCGFITAFGGLGSATIQAAITKHVPSERVGQLLGAIGQLHALARIFSPILFNGLYAATVETFPQAFFVVLSSLFVLCLGASLGVRSHVFMTEDETEEPEPSSAPRRNNSVVANALEDEELLPPLP